MSEWRNGQFRKTRHSYHLPGHLHEYTFSCYKRQPFLAEFNLYESVCEGIDAARQKLGFQLVAYVLMPEHVHLLIRPPDDGDTAAILYGIKRPVGLAALRHIRMCHPTALPRIRVKTKKGFEYRLWQAGGGFDRNLFTPEAIGHAIDYIHNNPTRRGLIDDPRNWTWSSLSQFEGLDSGPLRVDVRERA